MEILGALVAGSAIGAVLGFVGAGGAMLSVPILVYLFGYQPHQASVAALAVVIVAALSGLYPRFKSREILVKEALIIWALGSAANIGAATLVIYISDSLLLIGSITGLFGIGGGFLAVPILVLAFNTPQNKAAGTSLLIIVLNCTTALVAHHSSWPDIKWSIPLFMGISALFVGQWAGKKSAMTNPAILRKSFAALLFAIAAFTLIETWLK